MKNLTIIKKLTSSLLALSIMAFSVGGRAQTGPGIVDLKTQKVVKSFIPSRTAPGRYLFQTMEDGTRYYVDLAYNSLRKLTLVGARSVSPTGATTVGQITSDIPETTAEACKSYGPNCHLECVLIFVVLACGCVCDDGTGSGAGFLSAGPQSDL